MSVEREVTENFTLLSIAFIIIDGRQHAINAAHLNNYIGEALERKPTIESIPWGELMSRRITSMCMQDGYLILGLSTKER